MPFRIPTTLDILFVDNPSFIVRRTGMPPPTAASNSRFTLFFSANKERWSPCLAITALFAVITCFLFFNATSITFFDIPSDRPTNSNTISIFGLLAINRGFL